MRLWCAVVIAALVGCGKEEKPVAMKKPAPAAPALPKAPEVKSDPTGKNMCLTCGLRTNDSTCPKCKAVLKASAPETPRTSPGEVGKSAVAPMYACPETGCTVPPFPSKGKCLKHAGTDMVLQWFVCEKCAKKEPVAGKCPTCGADLARKLDK